MLHILFDAFTERQNYQRGIASKLLHASWSRNKINKSLVSLAVRNTKTKTSWHTTSRWEINLVSSVRLTRV